MRRFRTMFGDFDTRCYSLEPPLDSWDEAVKKLHIANQTNAIEGLRYEYGARDLQRKIEDFVAIGPKPFSVQSYHNVFFDQVRRAFVEGAYFPALVAACALGERILNHLVLDLRDDYTHTPEHEPVATAVNFSSWRQMATALTAWGVIDAGISNLFQALSKLRHRSIHFSPVTYASARDDALSAIKILREILDKQFSAFGPQRWYIPGTLGACFVAKAFEQDPFVKKFVIPSAVYVGPLHNIDITPLGAWNFVDWPPEVYGDLEITDEQFKTVFNTREPNSLVSLDGPHVPATILGPED